jgi:negative regulator of sigma E activity
MSENEKTNEAVRISGNQLNEESLSALLDGEANELELRRILSSSSPEIASKWARLNASQAIIHGEGSELYKLSDGFAERVAQGIGKLGRSDDDKSDKFESQAADFGTAHSAVLATPWARGVAKVAVAACVALAFVVILQTSLPGNDSSIPAVAESSERADLGTLAQPQNMALNETADELSATLRAEGDAEAQKRLRDYIGSMTFNVDEPVRIEHIQDSPLYRLVSETIESPPQR